MTVFINGRFVPQEQALISVFDRGFLYGDGLFETIRVCHGRPFRWKAHLDRLQAGLDYLKIQWPCAPAELRDFATRLVSENDATDCLLRLYVSRGPSSRRGYSPAGAETPTVVMATHPAPPRATELRHWRVITSSVHLPANEPLANIKTSNKLHQVLAKAEADAAGADDTILLNTDGFAAEGSSSNVFWIHDGIVNTPPLAAGILPGVTRAIILDLCQEMGVPAREANVKPEQLLEAQAVFLSLTSLGVVQCESLDARPLRSSSLVQELFDKYNSLLKRETSTAKTM